MRPSTAGVVGFILWWLLSLTSIVAERTNGSYRPEQLSSCALECLQRAVRASHCELSDIECQCEDKEFIKHASSCAVKTCKLEDLMQLVRGDAAQCSRSTKNYHKLIIALAITTPTITFTVIILRVLSRLWTVHQLWWDDFMHILAGVFAIPLSIFGNICVSKGFGLHLYDIKVESVTQITNLFFWWYMCQIFWPFTIFFVKMSILLLYLRIFPIVLFRRVDFLCIAFLVISFLVTTPMAIWQCKPFQAAWDYDIDNARCLKIAAVAYANATLNIITEVLILILPLPVLRTLHVSRRKKIALISVFSVGVIVIAIASARMPALGEMGTYYDPPYSQAPAFLLSCVEAAMAHVCAAAPVIYTAIVQLKQARGKGSQTSPSTSREGQAGSDQGGGSGNENKKYRAALYSSLHMSDVAIMGRGWMQSQRRAHGSAPSAHHLERAHSAYYSDPELAASPRSVPRPGLIRMGTTRGSCGSSGGLTLLPSPEISDRFGEV
ncbi:hypothetical protein ANOM_006413 [Aspergillus nomiae NRRL 13137]|uniref:CFEM domain-containing protein n=1 Tax=Aspergillus nomiae NRRL (strain ATCC 15546 / NRRL 13137 / CBS 260.88 / M93) TaxID=1509407 RepID=A0A0L1J0I4_ASPN3|nr:uncharacterized protein ANOM_006413 [Aspergillus nomiae NRRL 13137]KNG84913.1 hypothetical protein ANOM_006413 [Aspergillus nomiae NRRL 13137]